MKTNIIITVLLAIFFLGGTLSYAEADETSPDNSKPQMNRRWGPRWRQGPGGPGRGTWGRQMRPGGPSKDRQDEAKDQDGPREAQKGMGQGRRGRGRMGRGMQQGGPGKGMMRKRMLKLEGIGQEIGAPEIYPAGQAELVLLGWGSTYGVLKETVDLLNQQNMAVQMIHYSELFPFNPRHIDMAALKKASICAVENNYTGQFADLFSQSTGLPVNQRILKYDGRPFTPGEIIDRLNGRI